MTCDTRIEPEGRQRGRSTKSACGGVRNEITRIVQESLTNTIKHANASRFKVKIYLNHTAHGYSILDDGKGFDPTLPHDGFGLIGY